MWLLHMISQGYSLHLAHFPPCFLRRNTVRSEGGNPLSDTEALRRLGSSNDWLLSLDLID